MIHNFQDDFTQLNQKLINGKPYSEIRKEYLKLVKKYHPDKAETSKKKLYEEYTIKIVNLYQNYMDKKIAAAEIDLANQKKQAQNQPDKKHVAATNPAQDFTYIKLMEVARKEYTAYKKIGFGFLPDCEELKARIEQFLKHLAKRKRCF